eukprot:620231-Rhodomonas_salina.3
MGWRLLGGRGAGSDVKESDNLGQSDGTYGKISSPGLQDLRSWQQLVSLWDRMEDPRVILHEAPSAFEIVAPACEGWVLLRRKTGSALPVIGRDSGLSSSGLISSCSTALTVRDHPLG